MGRGGIGTAVRGARQGSGFYLPKFSAIEMPARFLATAYTRPLMDAWLQQLLAALALPEYGLSTLFVVAFVAATLLPMGSEPVLFGLIKLNPELFWPAIAVATAGNTLGGVVTWWMGLGAHHVVDQWRDSPTHLRALNWLQRIGPPACFLSFLPVIGDPLCAVAGWLRMPLAPCTAWMAAGKFTRYVVTTVALLYVWPEKLAFAH